MVRFRARHYPPRVLFALPILLSGLAVADVSAAQPFDRIAAIAGEHVILESEVRIHARPFLKAIAAQPAADQPKAEAALMHEICERLVDEYLEDDEAARLHIAVTDAEVSAGIDRIAQQNGVTVQKVLAAAEGQGMNEADFRQEVRHQFVEGKLIILKSQASLQIGESELRERYEQIKKHSKDPSQVKPFDDVRTAVMDQIVNERADKVRTDMLSQLRTTTYVEIRLEGM